VQEDSYQAISRYRSGKRSDIQRASHAAQDIKTSDFLQSVRLFLKHGSNLAQTHTAKDPKGKSVMGESSKNAEDSHCFKCQGYCHVATECPLGTF